MDKGSVAKKILKGLSIVGQIYFVGTPPYYAVFQRLRKIFKEFNSSEESDSRFKNAFYYFKKKGYLEIRKKNHQIYIALTPEGRKRAGKHLIDDLEIQKPKNWDGKYRIAIFDIPNITRIKRDALRGKLKELGFFRLQQSVWVYPYQCEKEIDLLREFFGLNSKELILIEGCVKDDKFLQKFFKLA